MTVPRIGSADGAHTADPHYIYIAWAEGDPLYVGCSWNPAQRLASHRRSKWVPLTTHIDIFGPYSKAEALSLEREAVWVLSPEFNSRGKKRSASETWADAIWDCLGVGGAPGEYLAPIEEDVA